MSPGDFPDFRPRPPWLGGDLQTLRNTLTRARIDLAPWPARTLELPTGDGDRLLGLLHDGGEAGRPLVLLLHGLTGCCESTYLRATARHLLGHGYPVVRLNLRGAGPSRPLCRRSYHAGRSDDLRAALAGLAAAEPRLLAAGLVAVGYSLGGNLLLKYLAEEGRAAPFLAAASVSAPIDLKASQVALMTPRNALYHGYLLRRMKAEARAAPGAEPPLGGIRSVYDYDERIVAPANGFAGADDYYRRCSARPLLGAIAVPTLLVHALDDPWIPADVYTGISWGRLPRLVPLLPWTGGHVGFHGLDRDAAWHDRCILHFLDAQGAGAVAAAS